MTNWFVKGYFIAIMSGAFLAESGNKGLGLQTSGVETNGGRRLIPRTIS
jgi:hypothetical protein